MVTRFIALILMACAAATPAAHAQTPGSSAHERGQLLTRWLLAGQVDSLLSVTSPQFAAAVGGREGLVRLADRLAQQAGAERAVLEEAAFREAGNTTYYRISRFEKMASVTTRWIWNSAGFVVGATVNPTPVPADSEYTDYESSVRLVLPLAAPRAGTWYVAWGGRDAVHNHHVTAPDQRFAYDFVVVRGDNDVHSGEGNRNEDHFCWGEPVHAPAGGRVVAAVDSIPDNARPGERNMAAPPGNHVVIEHGSGEYSLLAHLRLGSVAVRVGDSLSTGTLLGECGNSGNSALPHVHYHLQTGPAYRAGAGLPAFFHDYFAGGQFVRRSELTRGQLIVPYVSTR